VSAHRWIEPSRRVGRGDAALPRAALVPTSPHTPPAAPAPAVDPTTAESRALCRRLAAGEPDAITALYRARFGLVLAIARRITGRDEAFGLDATQETFLRVISAGAALRRIETQKDLDRWLIRLTHSACIDLLRREQRRARRERARSSRGALPASDPAADIERLTRLLDQLDHDDRAMLKLRTSGFTLESVARIFGITTGAAHGRIRRTTHDLARGMKEGDHE
jgi:RNA polymerase sigma factor (sigma-70 family)